MRKARYTLVAVIAAASACGPAPQPAEPTAAASAPAPTAAVVAAAPPSSSGLLDAVPQDAAFVVRIDAKALRAAPIYAATLEAFEAKGLMEPVETLSKDCGFPVLDAVDEIVVSGNFDAGLTPLLVARVKPGSDAVMRCVPKLERSKPPREITLASRPALAVGDVVVVMPTEDVLLIGREQIARDAVPWIAEHKRGRSPLVGDLRTKPPVVISVSVLPPAVLFNSLDGALEADATHLGLSVVVDAGSPTKARELTTMAEGTLRDMVREIDAAGLPADAIKPIKALLAGVKIRSEGNKVLGEAAVRGGVAEQAAFMGSVAAVTAAAMDRYLTRSKAAEAKVTVGSIGRSLVAFSERETGPRGARATRFPPSAPRTPAKVPKGTAEPPGPGWDHPTWKALKFRVEQPSRYSYEIATSGDGKTATVRAFGDLDGDGKLSSFSIVVKMNKDGGAEMGSLESKDENE